MSYLQPPSSGYQMTSSPMSPPVNGSESMLLGSMLGELKSGQSQITHAISVQTDVLRQIHGQLSSNATLMAERLPEKMPSPASLEDRLKLTREVLKTLVPVLLLAAIVLGKITLLEGEGLLRRWLGLG